MIQKTLPISVPYFAGVVDQSIFDSLKKNNGDILAEKLKLCSALEIRYDLFNEELDYSSIASVLHEMFPCALIIGTIRLVRDGGKFSTEDSLSRFSLFQEILNASFVPNYIDIEVEELDLLLKLQKSESFNRTKIIISHHDFEKIPNEEELGAILFLAENNGASGFKVAAMSSSENDVLPLYDFIRENSKSFELFSLFAMGETGRDSRIKSLLCGANLTYCSLIKSAAPGQISIEDSIKAYNLLCGAL